MRLSQQNPWPAFFHYEQNEPLKPKLNYFNLFLINYAKPQINKIINFCWVHILFCFIYKFENILHPLN